MKQLIFTDPHIKEKNLLELEEVFSEIISYDADICICVGDYLERRPSPVEMYFATKWAKKFLDKYKRFVLVIGNHPKLDKEFSSEDYLSFLGVELHNTKFVLKDNNREYAFGHFMCQESKKYFGNGEISESKFEIDIKDLKEYYYSILGHQHTFQNINDSIYHLGSCRFIDFGETEVPEKYICTIEDDIEFIELKSVIPAIDVYDIGELLDVERNTKVRLIINSFDTFKNNINKIEKYKKWFYEFKIKLDFLKELKLDTEIETSNLSLEEIIGEWIENIKDSDVREMLVEEMRKTGLAI